MPELPDITVYIEALEPRIVGHRLQCIRITSPFLLRSVSPGVEELSGRGVTGVSRLGKRIVIELEQELFAVLHLMIAGRLRWHDASTSTKGRNTLAHLEFDSGTLVLTEAGSKRRASLHLVRGHDELASHDPGGLEVLDAKIDAFAAALVRGNHTLKRALTDPRLFSGIGNAYSDEILHRARLSPFKLSSNLQPSDIERLFVACRDVLTEWTERLRTEAAGALPHRVTAFHEAMAVHGRFGKPCPVCDSPVQRIVYAANESNYCATCQTGGRLLADRALSRLLKKDWPRSIEELERRGGG